MSKQHGKKDELSLLNDRRKPAQYRNWFAASLPHTPRARTDRCVRGCGTQGDVPEHAGAGHAGSPHQGIRPEGAQRV